MDSLTPSTLLICILAASALWYAWIWAAPSRSLSELACFWIGASFMAPLLGLWNHRLFTLGPQIPWWAAVLTGLASGAGFALSRPQVPGKARSLAALVFVLSGPGLVFFLIASREWRTP